MSAKSKYGYEKPFLYLARKLMGGFPPSTPLRKPLISAPRRDNSLEFVAEPALAAPEVPLPDPALLKEYEDQLASALLAPIPDEEDADQ